MRILLWKTIAALSSFIKRTGKPNTIRWMLPNEEPGSFDGDGVGLRPGGVGSELAGIERVVGAEKSAAAEGKFAGDDPQRRGAGSRTACSAWIRGRTTIWSSHFLFSNCRRGRGRYCGAVICRRNRCSRCATFAWIVCNGKVERSGRSIELTTKEFALLEYLDAECGRRLTRAMIIEHVWNLTFDSTTECGGRLHQLSAAEGGRWLLAGLDSYVRGVGYEMSPEGASA